MSPNVITLLKTLGATAFLALAVSCATTKQTENLLSAAGFKIVPANTPARQARLKELPPSKVTMVQRGGKEYFVYPDIAKNVFYVGQDTEYQEYQRLLEQNRLAEDQLNAEFNANWDAAEWGSWAGLGWR